MRPHFHTEKTAVRYRSAGKAGSEKKGNTSSDSRELPEGCAEFSVHCARSYGVYSMSNANAREPRNVHFLRANCERCGSFTMDWRGELLFQAVDSCCWIVEMKRW